MKTLLITGFASLAATAAQAHDGGHLHPHGIDGFALGLTIVLVAATLAMALRR